MPLYELICERCNGHPIEEFMEFSALRDLEAGALVVQCPDCGHPLRRIFSRVAIVGDTCAGNRSFEGWDEDLGVYVRGRSHRERLAREKGLVEYSEVASEAPYRKEFDEVRYIAKQGAKNDPETQRAKALQFKKAGDKRRRHAIRSEFSDVPEVTREDIAKTEAEMNK